jgi:carboxymethylenebutenolidase
MNKLARRSVMTGFAGLSLATLLADPKRVKAAADSLQMIGLKTPSGRDVAGAFGLPEKNPAGAVLMVHEWWGLNDQIKAVATELQKAGFIVLAADLYGGKVASNPNDAQTYMNGVDPKAAEETLAAWIDYLRGRKETNSKIGTIGWCFGGGWSLRASLVRPVEATVIYYGKVDLKPEELKPLKGPVLGQFANRDQWINTAMVNGFEAALKADGKTAEINRYDADHAFANPTGQNYDAADAQVAWDRTMAFLRANLT